MLLLLALGAPSPKPAPDLGGRSFVPLRLAGLGQYGASPALFLEQERGGKVLPTPPSPPPSPPPPSPPPSPPPPAPPPRTLPPSSTSFSSTSFTTSFSTNPTLTRCCRCRFHGSRSWRASRRSRRARQRWPRYSYTAGRSRAAMTASSISCRGRGTHRSSRSVCPGGSNPRRAGRVPRQSPRRAGRVPGRSGSATHTCNLRLGQADLRQPSPSPSPNP